MYLMSLGAGARFLVKANPDLFLITSRVAKVLYPHSPDVQTALDIYANEPSAATAEVR